MCSNVAQIVPPLAQMATWICIGEKGPAVDRSSKLPSVHCEKSQQWIAAHSATISACEKSQQHVGENASAQCCKGKGMGKGPSGGGAAG
jgi:hypothetical protein